ncbi:hypothetical protein D3C76_1255170 [compost metagenome]
MNLAHTTAEHGEPGSADLLRLQYRRLAPYTEPGLSSAGFCSLLTGDQIDIRRHGHLKTQAFGEHLRFEVGAIGTVDMSQGAAVMVLAFFARQQTNLTVASRYQGFESLARDHSERFVGTAILAQFRRIQADHAHTAAIAQAQGVAVHHPLHRDRRQAAGCRAKCLGAG